MLHKATKSITAVTISLICAILFFVIAEFLVRFLMPEVNFTGESASLVLGRKYGPSRGYAPDSEGVSWGAKIYTDSRGFRVDPKEPPAEDSSLPSIVILGDSVSLGIGVPAEKTFVNLISRKMGGYNIYNTSVTGYFVSDYRNVVEKFVIPESRQLKIKKVFLFYSLSDVHAHDAIRISKPAGTEKDMIKYGRIGVFIDKTISYPYSVKLKTFLAHHSKLYHVLKKIFHDSSKKWFFQDYNAHKNDKNIDNVISTVDYIRDILSGADIECVVFIIPYEYQLRRKKAYLLLPQKMISRKLGEINIKCYDLYAGVSRALEKESIPAGKLFLFNDHCHLSDIGHRITAQEVLRCLESR
ncbi:MAG: hypothetical protein A2Z72_00650 [Omnitrophica bacterium RBG_13_46_9]|nr:MAG: hypothetical protein A2Z72_00650 [Omnitrophica bacterium RBG_13_46_9]